MAVTNDVAPAVKHRLGIRRQDPRRAVQRTLSMAQPESNTRVGNLQRGIRLLHPRRWPHEVHVVDLSNNDRTSSRTDRRRLYLEKSGLNGHGEQSRRQRVALLHAGPRQQTSHSGRGGVAQARGLVVEEPDKREEGGVELLHRAQDTTTRHRVVRVAAIRRGDAPLRVLLQQRSHAVDHGLRAAANTNTELHRAKCLCPPRTALRRNGPRDDATPDGANGDGPDTASRFRKRDQPRRPEERA